MSKDGAKMPSLNDELSGAVEQGATVQSINGTTAWMDAASAGHAFCAQRLLSENGTECSRNVSIRHWQEARGETAAEQELSGGLKPKRNPPRV